MKAYLDLLRHVRQHGEIRRPHRHGHDRDLRRSFRFDLAEGFPLVTTKKVHLKSITHELSPVPLRQHRERPGSPSAA
jgi:thymidylate synthase